MFDGVDHGVSHLTRPVQRPLSIVHPQTQTEGTHGARSARFTLPEKKIGYIGDIGVKPFSNLKYFLQDSPAHPSLS
jgi:hypothetical protein